MREETQEKKEGTQEKDGEVGVEGWKGVHKEERKKRREGHKEGWKVGVEGRKDGWADTRKEHKKGWKVGGGWKDGRMNTRKNRRKEQKKGRKEGRNTKGKEEGLKNGRKDTRKKERKEHERKEGRDTRKEGRTEWTDIFFLFGYRGFHSAPKKVQSFVDVLITSSMLLLFLNIEASWAVPWSS